MEERERERTLELRIMEERENMGEGSECRA
jgi:hypothetical protein